MTQKTIKECVGHVIGNTTKNILILKEVLNMPCKKNKYNYLDLFHGI